MSLVIAVVGGGMMYRPDSQCDGMQTVTVWAQVIAVFIRALNIKEQTNGTARLSSTHTRAFVSRVLAILHGSAAVSVYHPISPGRKLR